MNQNQTNEEMEIDLLDLASKLLDKWYYLLLCLLARAFQVLCKQKKLI